MARKKSLFKKTYIDFPSGGYGWAGMDAKKFANSINKAGKMIKELQDKLKFDAIAFTGSSGAAIAFHVAALYEIPVIYVRKEGEKCHGSQIESNANCSVEKYLIVDDFICSGDTIRRIVDKISKYTDYKDCFPAEAVGIFCYDEGSSRPTLVVNDNLTLPIFTLNQPESE